MGRLSDAIRGALKRSGLTNYRVSKLTGISQATLSRFVRGIGDLQLSNADILAELLDLDIRSGGRPGGARKGQAHGKREH